jgi:2-polyprenyl-6-methoxyphenol hydroxylase-like FAD-dependent oxidoreductase
MEVNAVEIIVIGGGIGGLTAALALAQGGHRVQVLERAGRFAQPGPALRLAPNATAVLCRLGLLDHVLDLGVRPRRALLRDLGSGAELAELDLGAPLTARYGTPYVVIGRADLLSVLADGCADADVELRPGRDAVALDQSHLASSVMGGAVVSCAGGQVYAGDVVLAADGPHSVARGLVGGRVLSGRALSGGAPSGAGWAGDGWAAYRGTVPADALAPDEARDEVVAWMGPDAHFTRYPIRVGEAYEQVAAFRSHLYSLTGPSPLDPLAGAASPGGVGQRQVTPGGADARGLDDAGRGGAGLADAGLADAGRGASGLADAGPAATRLGGAGPAGAGPVRAGRGGLLWGGPEELDEAFSWATGPVRAAVRSLRGEPATRLLDRAPLASWTNGRIALLGDAVHPMPGYLAQGACQAIEDAAALADVLRDCPGPRGVQDALAGYQNRRAARAIRVARARQLWESAPLTRRAADDYAVSDWLYAPAQGR